MPEQVLDHVNVDTLFEQMGSEAMSQRVHGDRLANPGHRSCSSTSELQRALCYWSCRIAAGKQPVHGPATPPIVAKNAEQLLGQNGIAILAAFTLPNADDHACTVDIPH